MKKFINHVDDFLVESLAGFGAAHSDLVVLNQEPVFVRRKTLKPGKVALISGGGSGHEPLHIGFVGYGMLDAACPGQVFTSPTPDQMMAAAQAVDTGAGTLFIVKNYSGDLMNFEMASEMSELPNAMVLINDDVAVENSSYTTGRRGVAGAVIVEKLVGSLAESGADLEQCKAFGDRINKHTASMGVAFSSCTVPAAGTLTFKIGDDEIEVGVGIHGEPGRRRARFAAADAIAGELLTAIVADLKPPAGAELLVLINGLGGTPLGELYLLFNSTRLWLQQRDLKIARVQVDSLTTSLEMAGASITLCVMNDEMLRHWDSAVHTPSLRWGM
ncbi:MULTISPECIES: dihydroxyacetone kinase subunit DhaK [Paraburkholderia]|jgi:dihydroxyacetone kinase-like protein|uniref:Dihydroxyacetone kinase subunit DhaK n=2 Tax=Paraburkholderia caribensis TaxID=75105 RepID=A0A9Q6WPH3_9BURK|nr:MULTISPECIES: dihydroxyacetone kinase subunit DhaK [Paraburkholderia]ALL69363.1 dihydroxyacetone kinase DhaK subunit [Paraburkholderia caribensis MBA4]ALP64491.1 dihydroxyacetone kinase [Paraburkholderia caribensis]AMV45242.1 dihydroxyacetone kinase [Paraburkholderia caribensis]AUT54367.1 dihydroxyacetone kinase subunit DhaK [Paraburkholderia caribensis]MCO4880140.1 dihydroxyacetone kinase subunit DhaK [Paraburkholderia caribensis]